MFSYIITTYTTGYCTPTHPPSTAGSHKVLDCWWRCVVQVHRTVRISRSNEPRVTVCRRLQRHTIATPAAVVVEEILLNMFLEKCQESTGTFWRGTTPPQIHITGISCLSTSYNASPSFIARCIFELQLLKVLSSRSLFIMLLL